MGAFNFRLCLPHYHDDLRVTVNGEARTAPPGITVPACWPRWESTHRVAIERNRTDPAPTWNETALFDGRPAGDRRVCLVAARARAPAAKDDDVLVIGGKRFHSRLLGGTGKYRSIEEGARPSALRRRDRHGGPAVGRLHPGQAQRPGTQSIARATRCYPTPPAATRPRRPSEPAGWRASWGWRRWSSGGIGDSRRLFRDGRTLEAAPLLDHLRHPQLARQPAGSDGLLAV